MSINAIIDQHLTVDTEFDPFKLNRVGITDETGTATMQAALDLHMYNCAIDNIDGESGRLNVSRSYLDLINIKETTFNIYQTEQNGGSIENAQGEFYACKFSNKLAIKGSASKVVFIGCKFENFQLEIDTGAQVEIRGDVVLNKKYGLTLTKTRFNAVFETQWGGGYTSAGDTSEICLNVIDGKLEGSGLGMLTVQGTAIKCFEHGKVFIDSIKEEWRSSSLDDKLIDCQNGRIEIRACAKLYAENDVVSVQGGYTKIDRCSSKIEANLGKAVFVDGGVAECFDISQGIVSIQGTANVVVINGVGNFERLAQDGGFCKIFSYDSSKGRIEDVGSISTGSSFLEATGGSSVFVKNIQSIDVGAKVFDVDNSNVLVENIGSGGYQPIPEEFVKITSGEFRCNNFNTISQCRKLVDNSGGKVYCSEGVVTLSTEDTLYNTGGDTTVQNVTVTNSSGKFLYTTSGEIVLSENTVTATSSTCFFSTGGSIKIFGGSYTTNSDVSSFTSTEVFTDNTTVTASSGKWSGTSLTWMDTNSSLIVNELTDTSGKYDLTETTFTASSTITLSSTIIKSVKPTVTGSSFISTNVFIQDIDGIYSGDWTNTSLTVIGQNSTFGNINGGTFTAQDVLGVYGTVDSVIANCSLVGTTATFTNTTGNIMSVGNSISVTGTVNVLSVGVDVADNTRNVSITNGKVKMYYTDSFQFYLDGSNANTRAAGGVIDHLLT